MNYQVAALFVSKYKYILIFTVLILIVIVYLLIRRKKEDDIRLIDDLKVNANNLSISDNQAKLIVENILSAMDQYGTDEETIINNLKNLNKDDLLFVIKKFGTKPYNGTSLASNWIDKTLFSPEKNLIGWLKAELDGNDLKAVRKIFEDNEIPF